MKVNEYLVMEECLEIGIKFGLNRAYKHNDDPSKEDIVEAVLTETMNSICEKFKFTDFYED